MTQTQQNTLPTQAEGKRTKNDKKFELYKLVHVDKTGVFVLAGGEQSCIYQA